MLVKWVQEVLKRSSINSIDMVFYCINLRSAERIRDNYAQKRLFDVVKKLTYTVRQYTIYNIVK